MVGEHAGLAERSVAIGAGICEVEATWSLAQSPAPPDRSVVAADDGARRGGCGFCRPPGSADTCHGSVAVTICAATDGGAS